jgi:hypothetical protein
MIFCRWPDAGLREDPAVRYSRSGDRRDMRPARDLRAPERREMERREGVMPIPPGLPAANGAALAAPTAEAEAADLPAPPAAKGE